MAQSVERFGEYDLIRRLGVGGMAEAFVAVRRRPGGFEQRICLKRILPAFRDDPEFVRMFMQEARLSALLHHPHIARVLDFGVIADNHYLTLELIEGTDLRRLLGHLRAYGRQLGHELTTLIATSVASALAFAHTADEDGKPAGLVHRDVSPSNILLSKAGEIKLTDFGIAKDTRQSGSVQSTALKGKVPYMAPEYALELRSDARTDLFSLGVVLYECLAGRRPFDGDNDIEIIDRARRGDVEPLSRLVPDAPRPLVVAVERLISPSPDNRPSNASTLLDALTELPHTTLGRRRLGRLVRECVRDDATKTAPGLASTRPQSFATRRPRKHLRSRR